MTPLDVIMLAPLAYGAYEGYKKGFILIVVGFLSLVVGVIGAFKLLQEGINFFMVYFPNMPTMVPFIAFVSLFVGIAWLIYLLGIVLKKTLKLTVFAGVADNLAGATVGFLHWAFILSILVWMVKQSHFFSTEDFVKNSIVYNYLDMLAPKIVSFFGYLLPFASGLFESIKKLF